MADLDINFRSTHEGDGGRKSQEEIDALNESAKKATPSLDTMALKAAAAAAVVAGLTAAVNKAVTEFAESEVAVTALDAALAQHGNLVESVRTQYQNLASSLSETTAIADEEWLRVLTTLTKFGTTPEGIEAAAEAVKNLAGFMGGDLNSAATLVGKALQGQFTQLSRYGIVIDETKSHAEKLESVFQQLAARGGGQLEARAATLRGQWDQLKNASGELWEGFGNLISRSGVMQEALFHLTHAAQRYSELLPGVVEQNEKLKNKTDEYTKKLVEQAAAERELKEAIEEEVKALEKKNHATERANKLANEVLDAETALTMAEIDTAEATGTITSEQAGVDRAAVKGRAALSKAQRDHVGLLERQGNIAAALRNPNLDAKTREKLTTEWDDVQAELTGSSRNIAATRAGAHSGEMVADAAKRKAEEKAGEKAAREAEKEAKELERGVQRELQEIKRSAKSAGATVRESSEATRGFMETLMKETAETRQRVKQLESQFKSQR